MTVIEQNELKVVNVRLVKEPSLYSDKSIHSPQDAIDLMAKELSTYDREVFCILNLKTNKQVINMNIVSLGTLDASLVSMREVYKSSILANSACIIALHAHPSGNIEPSQEDIQVTRYLKEAGDILGIKLIDHIIVGGGNKEMFSFRVNNMIETEPENALADIEKPFVFNAHQGKLSVDERIEKAGKKIMPKEQEAQNDKHLNR